MPLIKPTNPCFRSIGYKLSKLREDQFIDSVENRGGQTIQQLSPIAGFIHVMENLENLEKYFCHGMSWKCHGILFFWKSHGNVMEFDKNVMEKVCFYKFHNYKKNGIFS